VVTALVAAAVAAAKEVFCLALMTWAKIVEAEVEGLPCETLDLALCFLLLFTAGIIIFIFNSWSLLSNSVIWSVFSFVGDWTLGDMVEGVMLKECVKNDVFPFTECSSWLVMLLQFIHVILYYIPAWVNFHIEDMIIVWWQYKVHVLKIVFPDFCLLNYMNID